RNGGFALEAWQRVELSGIDAARIIDLGWSAPSELFVLVADHQDATSVVRATQDSARVSDIGPSNAIDLAELAVAPGYQMLARSSSGVLYRFDADFSWTPWVVGISAVTYAG
ncbi:MAG: hypothetical protein LBI99_05755, partial [Propionibacteriaceae bacterium]|nr:hypothetical protein [Propionibacteriaceae bacterium]